MSVRRCANCGAVLGFGVCAIAMLHHSSLCGQFDQGRVYCSTVTAELPHGSHHQRPVLPSGPYTVSVASTSSSGTITSSGTIAR
jgi:hypothetical protein